MRWTGNGLADGTAITSTAIANTAGNGDPVTYSQANAGAGAILTGGDGIDVWGDGTRVLRLDATISGGTRALISQVTFTAREATTSSDNHIIVSSRDTGANRAMSLRFNRAGTTSILNAAGTVIATIPTALVLTHRYLIDTIVALAASPTTSNGRIVHRIISLSDPSGWNGGQPYFFDTGYAANVGTTLLGQVQFGKAAQGPAVSQANPNRLEQLGWASTSDDLTAKTARGDIEPYFMANPWSTSIPATIDVPAAAMSAVAPTPTIESETNIPSGGPATFTIDAPTPTVSAGATVEAAPATLSLTAQAPTVAAAAMVEVPSASFAVSAVAPVVEAVRAAEVTAPAATFALAALPPLVAVSGAAQVTAPPATFSLAAVAPEVTGNAAATVAAAPATFTVAARPPQVATAATVQAPAATFQLSAPVPQVTATRAAVVLAEPAHLTLAALAPLVAATVEIGVPAATFALAAPAPTVQASGADDGLAVPRPALALTGAASVLTLLEDA